VLKWDEHAPQMGFLTLVLCIIQLSDGVVDSETLFTHLKRLGLGEGTHPVLGDWKKVLDTFVREMYLHKKRGNVGHSGAIVYEFRKGPRAMVEIDQTAVMKFVAGVFGDDIDPLQIKEMELRAKGLPQEPVQEKEAQGDGDDSSSDSS